MFESIFGLLASSGVPSFTPAPTPDLGNDPESLGRRPGDGEAGELCWLTCENAECLQPMLADLDAYEQSLADGVLVFCQSCQHIPAEVAW